MNDGDKVFSLLALIAILFLAGLAFQTLEYYQIARILCIENASTWNGRMCKQ